MKSLIPPNSPLHAQLTRLATEQRIIFFAGLPGVGKSLLLQQIGLIAHQRGRIVHQLQWDVSRIAFETDAVLARYPEIDGVTHAVIRKAVGLWARSGVLGWHQQNPDPSAILIGEVPLVGNRLIELVQKRDDEAERLLTSPQTTFAIPVPSVEIRNLIEAAREKSIANPQHERDAKDAPPNVLRDLWTELFAVGQMLNLIDQAVGEPIYDPAIYEALHQYLLQHRQTETIPLDQRLDTSSHSVYDIAFEPVEVAPNPDEAEAFVQQVENDYPNLEELQETIDEWYDIG